MVSPSPITVNYPTYKSVYGPKYHFEPNVAGWGSKQILRVGVKSAAFGGAAVVGLLLFASSLPKIQTDILMKFPYIDRFYKKEIHPADNPF